MCTKDLYKYRNQQLNSFESCTSNSYKCPRTYTLIHARVVLFGDPKCNQIICPPEGALQQMKLTSSQRILKKSKTRLSIQLCVDNDNKIRLRHNAVVTIILEIYFG